MIDITKSIPVWLIGTHRSGTTMLSIVLDKMGCNMGWRKDRNNESTFMQKENNRLLKVANCNWDNPSNFRWFLERPDLCQIEAESSLESMRSLSGLEFWGPKGLYRSPRIDNSWGWKDPRMSITAPIWLKVFKRVKIIRVVRNGIDVAASLSNRENYFLNENKAKRPISMRCLKIDGAYSLWKEYVEAEDNWLSSLTEAEVYNCRYEDILQYPSDKLSEISEFLGLKIKNFDYASFKASRRYAFIENSDLVGFYNKVKSDQIMKSYGYDKII